MSSGSVRVSVVGLGRVGSAVVRVLLDSDHEVTVWNRTASRAHAAVEEGAVLVRDVAEAVAASPLTILPLTTYEAVHEVLDQVGSDLSGRTLAVLCTGTPAEAEAAAERAASLGLDYLDGGVQTAPDQIGSPLAAIVYSGSLAAFERHRGTLARLSSVHYLGPTPGAAASWDLALFGLWYDAQIGLLRALAAVDAAGIDPAAFAPAAATQVGHVVAAAGATASEMIAHDYPAGPADLGEHLRLVDQLIEQRGSQPLGDGGLALIRDTISGLIGDGRHQQGLTAVAG